MFIYSLFLLNFFAVGLLCDKDEIIFMTCALFMPRLNIQ